MSENQDEPEQFAIFSFNAQMWLKDIGKGHIELCELKDATIFNKPSNIDKVDFTKHIISNYPDHDPVVTGAMLVPIKEETIRNVVVLDKRACRDWDYINKIIE